jgi:hypothetical protein
MNDSYLESRMQHLECQLRLQRWLNVGLAAMVLAVAGVAATTSPVSPELRTKRLVVVNDEGGQAISLEGRKAGGAVEVFDAQGRLPLFLVGCGENGGELLIKNSRGENRVMISCDKTSGQISVSVNGAMRQVAGESSK